MLNCNTQRLGGSLLIRIYRIYIKEKKAMHDFKTMVPHTHDPVPYFEQFFTMWPRYAAT